MSQNTIRNEDWSWKYFYKDGSKYRRDRFHKNAWCKACITSRIRFLREHDTQGLSTDSNEPNAQGSEDRYRSQAIEDIQPICGKIKRLHKHLANCRLVDRGVRSQALLRSGPNNTRSSNVRTSDSANIPMDLDIGIFDDKNGPALPSGDQTWFESALCRVAASAGWSWHSLNDPEWIDMMQRLRPDLKVPGRRTLAGRILNDEVNKVMDELRKLVGGRVATGMCDGWKNIKKDSLIASMITVDYEAHITNIHNVSAQRKTAQKLLELVRGEIEYCEKELGVKVIAWCTDASGESRAMRNRLVGHLPQLIMLDCYAHQINLIVGDYFKRLPAKLQVMDAAYWLVHWFRNHSFALGLLRKCQAQEYNGRVLALILPVLTRWTAHYCAAARLLDVMHAIRICIAKHEAEILESAGPIHSDARKLAVSTLAIATASEFWEELLVIKTHLEPLAIAANVTQAANTRLDHVTIAMGQLYHLFENPSIPDDVRTVVQTSAKSRWIKGDSDAFIASVYLNPQYRHHILNQDEPGLRPLGLYIILRRLFTRIFPKDTLRTREFMIANEQYAGALGVFSAENMLLEELDEFQSDTNPAITVVSIWAHIACGPVSGVQQLAKLAAHVLSIVPNSAGCERLFSQMGIIHSKLRNRLHEESVQKLMRLKLSIRGQQERAGRLKPRGTKRYQLVKALETTEEDIDTDGDSLGKENTETEVDYEPMDTRQVLGALIDDVNNDEDIETETQIEAHQNSSTPDIGQSIDEEAPPNSIEQRRIIFIWSREITLDQLFNFSPTPSTQPSWSHAYKVWTGGVANLADEMHHYGLDDMDLYITE
ncbi:hypothetical protein RHS01_09373 [Rhizoctonia solani]|uniref:DUF659 domain-containing protein n=1 Tax=Rhizoctonia solani TaxID=456999 RepID=A0A8H7I3Q7_9AGAM|nr:hypothetical protein RHS01_09373 [Rhizoctonia solani]